MGNPLAGLEAKTEREILLVLAGEMRHMQNHTADLAKKVGEQNGRIDALEKWRWWMLGAMAVIVPLSPLLIYEVRQSVFTFTGGG